MNLKLIRIVLVGLAINVLLFSCSNREDSNKIKIGALIAQTGYGAMFGESEVNALRLLEEKYGDKIVVYIEDNKSNAKDGVTAVNKLLNLNNVDVIYTDLTTVANAISPIVKSHDKVLLAAVYLSTLLDNNKYAIRNLPRGSDEVKLLMDFLVENQYDVSKVASIVSNDEFGNSSNKDFKGLLKDYESTIVYEGIIPDALGIKSEVSKLIKLNPNVVFIASLQPHLGTVVKELRVQGFKGEIITTDAFAFPYIYQAAGEYAKNTIYVDFPTTAKSEKFAEEYKLKFNSDLIPTAILCYDGLSIVLDNISQTNGNGLQNLFESLEQKTYDGIYGKIKISGREIIYPQEVKIWP